MHFVPLTVAPPAVTPAAPSAPWCNPAAAAALNSSAELLKGIEEGIVRNFGEPDRVRVFANDLRSTNEILATASEVLLGDAYAENDQFVPLVNRAGAGVTGAEAKLSSKDFASTWPSERDDIISAIRQARVLSLNVARQLSAD